MRRIPNGKALLQHLQTFRWWKVSKTQQFDLYNNQSLHLRLLKYQTWAAILTFRNYYILFRAVYHCPFCNLCRVGEGLGIDYFHCMTCNCCLGMKLVNHKCLEKSLETNCPICCEFLFTSSEAVRALPCGHYMHSACFQVCKSLFIFSPLNVGLPCIALNQNTSLFLWSFSGLHLQPLHMSNLWKITRRYGGKLFLVCQSVISHTTSLHILFT